MREKAGNVFSSSIFSEKSLKSFVLRRNWNVSGRKNATEVPQGKMEVPDSSTGESDKSNCVLY